MVYTLTVFFVLIITLMHDNMKRGKKELAFFAFFVLFALAAIRYRIGADYTMYEATYNEIRAGITGQRIDISTIVLDKLLIFLGLPAQWYFIITAFLGNYIVLKTITGEYKRVSLSFFIYICGTLYFSTYNTTRQCLAIVIFYYSLRYIKEENPKKYIVLNIIGTLFHTSAILFIPFYFIAKIDFKKKYFAAMAIVYLCSGTIVSIAAKILAGTKYGMYLTNPGFWDAWGAWKLSNYLNLLLFLLYYFLIKNKNTKDVTYMNVHFLGVLVSLIVTSIPLADRVFIGFRFVEFLSVPNLISRLTVSYKVKLFIKIVVYCLYFYYFVHNVLMGNSGGVMPYQSII